MDQGLIFVTIAGMAVVTYLPRVLPAWLLSSRQLPPRMVKWLGYVPTAVLSAMLAPALLVEDGKIDLSLENTFLWVGLVTVGFAWKTRSFFGTVALGMALVAAVRWLTI